MDCTLLHLAPRAHGPDRDEPAAARDVVEVVQVDGRVDVARYELDAIADARLGLRVERIGGPGEDAVLVTRGTVAHAGAVFRLRKAAVGRERLEARVDDGFARPGAADHGGEDRQRWLELGAEHAPVRAVHEYEGARLHLGDTGA